MNNTKYVIKYLEDGEYLPLVNHGIENTEFESLDKALVRASHLSLMNKGQHVLVVDDVDGAYEIDNELESDEADYNIKAHFLHGERLFSEARDPQEVIEYIAYYLEMISSYGPQSKQELAVELIKGIAAIARIEISDLPRLNETLDVGNDVVDS